MSDEIPLSDAERAFFDAMNGGAGEEGMEEYAAATQDELDKTYGGSGNEDNILEEESVQNDGEMREGEEEEQEQEGEGGQENVSDHRNIGKSEDGAAAGTGTVGDSSVSLKSGDGDSSAEANPTATSAAAVETSSVVVPTLPVLPHTSSSATIAKPDAHVNATSKPATPADNKPPVTATVVAPSESNSKAAGGKRKRLPQDVVGHLEDRIAEDPKGDVDAWLGLIDEYKRKGKFDDARTVYERFLVVFPTAVRII